ncbi:flippase-like domain-containing protein, partial [bacterium]|nr:flippase-like domain-containing protein [bacterium]
MNISRLLQALKIVVSVSLIGYLLTQLDWSQFSSKLTRVDEAFLLYGLLATFIIRIIMAYKWLILLDVRGLKISFWTLFSITQIGNFWGLFLPSSVSIDIVRSVYLMKASKETALSVTSVVLDRILGVYSLLVMVIIGLSLSDEFVSGDNLIIAILGFCFAIALLIFLFNESTARFFSRVVRRVRFQK